MSDKRLAVDAWEALFRSQVSVMRHLHSEFPSGELSLNEYDVLLNLTQQESKSLRIKDLNRHLLLTQPSVSRLIDRLAARGIVCKSSDPGDARGIVVGLTDLGTDLFRRAAVRHAESIARHVGAALTDDELHQLVALCAKLKAAEIG